jgi:hypothetical protein
MQVNVGNLGKPTGVSASDWSSDEASQTLTWTATSANPSITLLWTQLSTGTMLAIALSCGTVASYTVAWAFTALSARRQQQTTKFHRTLSFGVATTAVGIVLLFALIFLI